MGISAISSLTALDTSQTTQATSKKKAPPPPGGAGGAPPAGGGGQASSATQTSGSSSSSGSAASNSKIYDKRDANKDGVVSYEEAMQYALKHPTEAVTSQTTAQGYTQQGTAASGNSGSASTFSLTV